MQFSSIVYTTTSCTNSALASLVLRSKACFMNMKSKYSVKVFDISYQKLKNMLRTNTEWQSELVLLHDPEIRLNNPVLEKNTKLSKHLLYSDDYDIRPTAEEQDRLRIIIDSFEIDINNFNEYDKNLLWKFRNYLVDNKYALTKFLRIINQSSEQEVNIALDLINKWVPIDVSSALELLSGHFKNKNIRLHGINVLKKQASDYDLELYIMQLVQAIRFESSEQISIYKLSDLARFLLDRSLESKSFRLLNFLYWSVVVAAKSEDFNEDNNSNLNSRKYSYFLTKIETETKEKRKDYYDELELQKYLIEQLIELSVIISNVKGRADDKKDKLKKLISINGKFKHLLNFEKSILMPLRPSIRVTGIDPAKCSVFKSAMCPLLLAFRFHKDYKNEEDVKQQELDNNNNNDINSGSDDDDEQIINTLPHSSSSLRKDNNHHNNDKNKRTQLIDLDNDEYYKIIWKNGDDIRQDQLIIQMIHLMDNLLKEVNLNLYLTPYPVLATGLDHGMLEFVPDSPSIAKVLEKYNNNISIYLESNCNGKQQELALIIDRFVKSLAGYCVITYLLGVGDRHLDNLLLTGKGYLFHIDFGYIYGEEPPLKASVSPKIRIIKQMIDVMGGFNSTKYKKFQKCIISSYNRLRQKAPLILNLLSLIGQGEIQQIEENVSFVRSRFRLDVKPEQAAQALLEIVEDAASGFLTKLLIDAPHTFATNRR